MAGQKANTVEFTLFPDRMTKAWLRRRTDMQLKQLAVEYTYDTCRGNDIRNEQKRRKEGISHG